MNLTRKAVYVPENYCPICGVSNNAHGKTCSPCILGAINAANTRILNRDEEGEDYFYDTRSVDARIR